MNFEPNYQHILAAAGNRKPLRLPLYEHQISAKVMERILGVSFADGLSGDKKDLDNFFKHYCRFFKEMTYDTVSFEVCIINALPNCGAIHGGRPGPIQNRKDFETYPWNDLPGRFWATAQSQLDSLARHLPAGMKAVGGIGNGVFEISEDIVGFEYLPFVQADDPELFDMIYQKIGDLMYIIWERFLQEYGEHFAVCRFGDDLGFKTGPLLSPATFNRCVLPHYRHIIGLIRNAGKPFLWHSCGNIFEIMDSVLELGINAKHSNEDVIAPFDTWIEKYSKKIGLFGGIDVDVLCRNSPQDVFEIVLERGRRFRANANGYALGSGNSIPDYVPIDGYMAMIEAVKELRVLEKR